MMIRDGVAYRIILESRKIRLVPVAKLLYTAPTSSDDLINDADGWMGMCAGDVTCIAAGGSDTGSSIDNAVEEFAAWLATGGFVGAGYELLAAILSGADSDEAFAIAIAIGGFEGSMGELDAVEEEARMKLSRMQEVRWFVMALITVISLTAFMQWKVGLGDPVVATFWIVVMLVLIYLERRYIAHSTTEDGSKGPRSR